MDTTLVTYALLAVAAIATPGPTVLLAMSNGSRHGLRTASYGIAGAALSDAILITVAALGLGAVLAASAVLFTVVKMVGVAYLLWIGIQMLRSSGAIGQLPQSGNGQPKSIFRKSLLVAVTNPKGYLFFTAFLPQFVEPAAPLAMQYVTLAAIFIAIDVTVMTAYAATGARAVLFLKGNGARWIDRTCGGVLVCLGLGLAFVKRTNV